MSVSAITAIVGFTATLLTIGGVLLQLARYRSQIRQELRSEVQNETRPNGGSSMRDALDRVEERQIDHGQRLVVVETRLCDHLSGGG